MRSYVYYVSSRKHKFASPVRVSCFSCNESTATDHKVLYRSPIRQLYVIRTTQKLLGHASLKITMICTHCVPVRTVKEPKSALDLD